MGFAASTAMTPLRITCVFIYLFAALILIITTVRSQQIENLQKVVEDADDTCSASTDLKKIAEQNLLKDFPKEPTKSLDPTKSPDVYYCHKEPIFIPPLYHIAEPPYSCVPQSVYYYPEEYYLAEEHSNNPTTSAVPKPYSTHYRLVQHILNDSAKSLRNVENQIWWNPGTASKPKPALLSESEARPLPPPSSDKHMLDKSSQTETVNEQEVASNNKSLEINDENVSTMKVEDDIVYTNKNIVKQHDANKDVSVVESTKTVIGQNTQLNEETSSSQNAAEQNLLKQNSESEDYNTTESMVPPLDDENDREKEMYSKLLDSILTLCRNISQRLESSSSGELAETPAVEKLQSALVTSNATSSIKSITEKPTGNSEKLHSESKITFHKEDALNTLHTEKAASVLVSQTESTSSQSRQHQDSSTTDLLDSEFHKTHDVLSQTESTRSQLQQHQESSTTDLLKSEFHKAHDLLSQTESTSSQLQQQQDSSTTDLLNSELHKAQDAANNSKIEECVLTLSNGKHIKESQLVDILESAKQPSEIILTIPNLLSGPLDKYQHVIENFPNSFVIDNAFVHLPNDLLVPYDTYKEVLDVFSKKSKTNLSKRKDVLLSNGKQLDNHIIARIIASTVCPHDRFIVLKGGTIVPYEIYKSYIDNLSQKDKDSVEIMIPYCAIPLPYTLYEEVVNSYLKPNTTDKTAANPLVQLWDSNEEVTLNTFLAVLNNANRQGDTTVTLPNKDVVPLLVYKDILDKLSTNFKQHSNVNLPNTEERLPYSAYKEIIDKYVNTNATHAQNATKSNCLLPLAHSKVFILTPHAKGLIPIPLPSDCPVTIPQPIEASNKTTFVCYPLQSSRHLHTFPFSPAPVPHEI